MKKLTNWQLKKGVKYSKQTLPSPMRKPSVPSKQHTRRHGNKTTWTMTNTTAIIN
jgi:hypothetical protein